MRAVLDTNVVASALLWDGTPERLIEAAGEGTLEQALGSYQGIQILSPADCLKRLRA